MPTPRPAKHYYCLMSTEISGLKQSVEDNAKKMEDIQRDVTDIKRALLGDKYMPEGILFQVQANTKEIETINDIVKEIDYPKMDTRLKRIEKIVFVGMGAGLTITFIVKYHKGIMDFISNLLP
jgi:hypothetical protein